MDQSDTDDDDSFFFRTNSHLAGMLQLESFESLVEKVRFKSFSTECQKLCYKIIFVWKLNVNKLTNAQMHR